MSDKLEMIELLTVNGADGLIATVAAPCESHEEHDPNPMYCELHHVIPRAWQKHWQPPTAPFPDTYDGQKLWDGRTMALCRSGHGNTHFWIVALMHELDANPDLSLVDLERQVRHKHGEHRYRQDFEVATLALARFKEVGGELLDLCANGLWGEI